MIFYNVEDWIQYQEHMKERNNIVSVSLLPTVICILRTINNIMNAFNLTCDGLHQGG